MRSTGLLFIFLLFCAACTEQRDHKGLTPLVEVDGNFLYEEDLKPVLPADLSKDDSLLFVEHYIRTWAEDVLLYQQAQNNIPDNADIERLVENYRKALIVHAYQQELVNQKLSTEITEQEMADYYAANKMLFKLDRPLIKGLFIKVPLTAPQLNNVRSWYKNESQEAIDKLEKYSLQNAVKYEYFYNKWISLTDVLDMIPLQVSDPEEYFDEHRNIEVKDSDFWYFLNVSEFLPTGAEQPFEVAKPRVKDMIINLKQMDFMKQVKSDLYQRAVDRKRIIYY